jgi:hypothetical protein
MHTDTSMTKFEGRQNIYGHELQINHASSILGNLNEELFCPDLDAKY